VGDVVGHRQGEDVHPLQRPAVRVRGDPQFVRGFGRRDPQASFVVLAASQHELQRERRFARARRPFDDIHPSAQQSAAEERVEALVARRRPGGLGRGAARVLLRRGRCLNSHVTILPV
jgi:hypothetical protein